MNLLLDTHLLLCAASQPKHLSTEAKALLLSPASTLMFSAASILEITIKNALGREDFQIDPRRFWRMLLAHDYSELPIRAEHAVVLATLPPLHKDPFDRILVAQAKAEAMILLTNDAVVADYGEPVRMV